MALHKTGLEQWPLEPHFILEEIKEIRIDCGEGLISVTLKKDGENPVRCAPYEFFTLAERNAILAFIVESTDVNGGTTSKGESYLNARRTPKMKMTTADLRPLTDADFEMVTMQEIRGESGEIITPKTKIRMLKSPRPAPAKAGQGGKRGKGKRSETKKTSNSL